MIQFGYVWFMQFCPQMLQIPRFVQINKVPTDRSRLIPGTCSKLSFGKGTVNDLPGRLQRKGWFLGTVLISSVHSKFRVLGPP